MEIKLAYGKSGLRIRLPDQIHTEVIEPRYVKGFDDQFNAVREALEHPVDHPQGPGKLAERSGKYGEHGHPGTDARRRNLHSGGPA